MKIALVRKFYTPYGGAERYLAQLVERLCRQGHEVHLFASRWIPYPQNIQERKSNLIFHRVPMIPSPSFIEALSFAFFSKRLLQQDDFEVIHSFERTLYQDIYRAGDGCHREWLRQRRVIDPWIKRATYRLNPLHRSLLFLEKRLFQDPRLKRIIANSHKGKEEIIRHYGTPAEKIEVIYNGVDLEEFNPRNIDLYRLKIRAALNIPTEAWVILFLGSGFRRKGLDGLLASLPRIKKAVPVVRLIVAGKDPIRGYLEKTRQWGITQEVIFLGPSQRARELYAACDLFALPTLYDPFSNACLEAMATGIPVLTTRQNGMAEVLEDGKDGFLIQNPGDPEEIAEKVLLFFSKDKQALGEKAREKSLSLDLEVVTQRMLRIYEEFRKSQ
jgi:UDP-glucose:(heptosyl)LPS alpha-1,3-glucosyltransferase